MFILMLHVEGISNPFGLRYRTEEKARAVFDLTKGDDLTEFEDDYGQRVAIPVGRSLVPQVVAVHRDLEARGEIALIEARAQTTMQSKAASDPVLGLVQARGQLVRPS